MQSRRFKIDRSKSNPEEQEGYRILRVIYSAICRTDARLWETGHRDLILPRVPGHEIAAFDEKTDEYFTVWPGQVCGYCPPCLGNRENLCENMKIMGFHVDGGWADHISVPEGSLVAVPKKFESAAFICFAEPVACIVNSLKTVHVSKGRRVVIYGGGVVGLLAGLVCRRKGADVVVIEKDDAKIQKALLFAEKCEISLMKAAPENTFDISINCCDCHDGFSQCILALKKGGHFCFFSGLLNNKNIVSNVLNTIHYREITLSGSYGPRKNDMKDALHVCFADRQFISLLIEDIISPLQVEQVIAKTAQGKSFKYIIDFR
jgi:nicotinate-nucleotide--dimethylbenzimidazole phosphoribosyltransferase